MKLMRLLAVSILLFLCIGGAGAVSADIIGTIDSLDEVKVDQKVTVPVMINAVSDIVFFEAEIDTNVANAEISVNSTRVLDAAIGTYQSMTDKLVSWTRLNCQTLTGPATLFYIDVTPKTGSEGLTIPINFTEFDADDLTYKLPVSCVNGTIRVKEAVIPPVVGDPVVSEVNTTSAVVTFTVTEGVPDETMVNVSSASGFFSVPAPATGNPGEYSASLTDLTRGTEYTVSGWAVNEAEAARGFSVSFTTLVPKTIVLSGDLPSSPVAIGTSGTLFATVYDDSVELPDEEVSWSSSNESVITIDASGSYSVLAPGTVRLSASSVSTPAVSNTTDPVVVPERPSVRITAPVSTTFTEGEEISFTAVGSEFGEVTYTWNFGDETSGTENTTTHAYASPGTYQVTVTASGTDVSGAAASASDSLTLTIQIKPPVVGEPTVSAVNTTSAVVAFTVTGGAPSVTAVNVSSSSGSFSVPASATETPGEYSASLTGLTRGTVYTVSGWAMNAAGPVTGPTASFTTLVPNVIVLSGDIPPSPVAIGTSGTLSATVYNGSIELPDEGISWSSSNKSVITIDASGIYSVLAPGTARLSASSVSTPAVSNTTDPVVVPERPSVMITAPTSTTFLEDDAISFAAVASDFDDVTYTWNFGDETSGTGNTTTHGYTTPGTYQVTVTASGTDVFGTAASASASLTLTIEERMVPSSVKFAGSALLEQGMSGTFAVEVYDQLGGLMTGESVVFSVISEGNITVDASGAYSAATAGMETVRYSAANNVSATGSQVVAVNAVREPDAEKAVVVTDENVTGENAGYIGGLVIGSDDLAGTEIAFVAAPPGESTDPTSDPVVLKFSLSPGSSIVNAATMQNLANLTVHIPVSAIQSGQPDKVQFYRYFTYAEPHQWMLLDSSYLGRSGDVYRYTVLTPGFSDFAAVDPVPVVPPAPVPVPVDNGGADDGLELLASVQAKPTTAVPTTTPTSKPVTDLPTQVPVTPSPTVTSAEGTQVSTAAPTSADPTETQAPVPVFGILAGLGFAVVLGRRLR